MENKEHTIADLRQMAVRTRELIRDFEKEREQEEDASRKLRLDALLQVLADSLEKTENALFFAEKTLN